MNIIQQWANARQQPEEREGEADAESGHLRHRHLFGVPKISADLAEEQHERASQWFELFVDLILVAAWTNVTGALTDREIGLAEALFNFWVTANIVQSGWLMYMHYQTRFIDESFLHTVQLFFFILGLAGIAVHLGNPHLATELAVAMVFQKMPLIVMYSMSAVLVERARVALLFSTGILVICTILSAAVAATRPKEYTPFALGAWTVVVVLETTAPLTTLLCVGFGKIIPFDIDHVQERTNSFIMIPLGELLLSAMVTAASLPGGKLTGVVYACLACVLIMAFSIGLLYFNIQPSGRASCYRWSKWRGFVVYFGTIVLCTTILLISVGVKNCFFAIANDWLAVTKGDALILFVGIALVLNLIFWLRVAHYWGLEPRPTDSAFMKRTKYIWWSVFGAWALVPLIIGVVVVVTEKLDPESLLAMAAAVPLVLMLAETFLTTYIFNSLNL